MARGHTTVLNSIPARERAKLLIDRAPNGYVASVEEPRRTGDQNDKMWAMLSDISVAQPEGRKHTPDLWKAVFMQACGWDVQFIEGLDGHPFPVGFRSSRMTKSQMSDLITFILEYGDRHGVRWTDPETRRAA